MIIIMTTVAAAALHLIVVEFFPRLSALHIKIRDVAGLSRLVFFFVRRRRSREPAVVGYKTDLFQAEFESFTGGAPQRNDRS